MFEQTVLESRRALGHIEDFERFTLPSFLTFDQTLPPLLVALGIGAALSFFDVTWFAERQTLYWSLCGAYFAGVAALEARQRRIKVDAYRIYLSQFSDEELQRVSDCPWTNAGISFGTKLAVGELLNSRRSLRAGKP